MKPAQARCEPMEAPAWKASFPVPASSEMGGRRAAELADGKNASAASALTAIECLSSCEPDTCPTWVDHLIAERAGQARTAGLDSHRMAGGTLRRLVGVGLAGVVAAAMVLLPGPSMAAASGGRATLTMKTVEVKAPGNPSVGIVPFTDAIYQTCADAPQSSPPCQQVGGVKNPYDIGQLEITVRQWVKFLNTADPTGTNTFNLYAPEESGKSWPKYGQIDFRSNAADGRHYSIAYPAWADKPYGFANFLRAARFVNSLYNGNLLAKHASSAGGFNYVTYKVRLARRTERGMYDLARQKPTGATRAHDTGFVVPSQNEWIKAAYYDPTGGGTFSYWKYPTNPGVFGDGTATAPAQTTLDPTTGDVTNASTQPLATYHASGVAAPSWWPAAVSADDCSSVNPFGIDPTTYAE